MMKRNVKIESNQNRTLTIDPPYSPKFKQGLIYIMDRLLGRVAPDQDLVYLFLTVLPDESINNFCELAREESFTSNKLLCTANYYLEEMATDICQGLQHKHQHVSLNRIMIEVFEEAFINKDLELPFFEKLVALQEFLSLSDLEINVLHVILHQYKIEKLHTVIDAERNKFIALICGVDVEQIDAILIQEGDLFKKGVLAFFFDVEGAPSDRFILLTQFIFNYFFEGMGILEQDQPLHLARAQEEHRMNYLEKVDE
jgi:hypothetical protein